MIEKKKQWEVLLTKVSIGIYGFLLMYYCGLNNWIRDCLQVEPSIFSIAALGGLACKVLLTTYERREWGILAIGVGIAAINLWEARDITVATNILVICSIKHVDMEKAMKGMFWSGVAVTGLIIVTSLRGGMPPVALTQDFGREVGMETRYCLGFYHPNHLHWQMVHMALLGMATYYRKMDWKAVVLWWIVNAGIYLLTASRSGLLCGTALGLLVLFYQRAERTVNTAAWKIVEMIGAGCLIVFSVVSVWLYNGTGFLAQLNEYLNNRIIVAHQFVETMPLTWWGSLEYSAITAENGYIRMLLGMGIIPFVIFVGTELLLLVWAWYQDKKEVRILVLLTLAYGFLEPIGFLKVFKNIALLYVGQMLFATASPGVMDQRG